MRLRLLPLIVLCALISGCYPQVVQAPPPPQPPVAALPAVVVPTPPAQKAQEAAVVIEKTTKEQELLAKQVATGVYQKIVEATRQNKVTQANYSKAQKAYDAVVSSLHAYSVLSPLGEQHADTARVGVAKALQEFLALAQQLKVL